MEIDRNIIEDCFLHYFDLHFINNVYKKYQPNKVDKEVELATKLAFLCCNSLVIPLASYFENNKCQQLYNLIKRNAPNYNIKFMTAAESISLFVNAKTLQYDKESKQYGIYNKALDDNILNSNNNLITKGESTTYFIKKKWNALLKEGGFEVDSFGPVKSLLPIDFMERCSKLDTLLGGLAYTPEYICNVLLRDCKQSFLVVPKLTNIINNFYFESYIAHLQDHAVFINLNLLNFQYINFNKYPLVIPFQEIIDLLKQHNKLNMIKKSSFKKLYELKRKNDEILSIIGLAINNFYKKQIARMNLVNKFIPKKEKEILNLEEIMIKGCNFGIDNRIFTSGSSKNNITQNNTSTLSNNINQIDWDKILFELNIIKNENKLPIDIISNLEEAVQKNDVSLFAKFLEKVAPMRDILISIGASYIANHIPTIF